MEIVKKNLIAFICAAVALIAIVAYFWPIGSMYSSFQEDLDKTKGTYTTINGLRETKFVAPRFSPTDQIPKEDTWLANQQTIDAAKKKADELKNSATQALVTAVKISSEGHPFLDPTALPQGNSGVHFRNQYNAVMDRGGKPEQDPGRRDRWPINLPDEVLQSTTPPTADEIQTARDKKWHDEYEQKIITANGQQVNLKEIQDQFENDTKNFVAEFYAAKATKYKLYMDDQALVRAPNLGLAATLNATDIWYGQMTLWIEQDVCNTIRDVNKSAHGIEESGVKNLMEVALTPDPRMYVTAQEVGAAGAAAPAAVDPSQTVYSKSPTGRVCNTLYDVVHFRMTAILDAQAVRPFLEQLRYGRYITVLNIQSQTVDTQAAKEQGYIYGKAPCVQLTMDCEELFMRDWTAPTRNIPGLPAPGTGPMPKEVQTLLGVPAVAPAAPATPGTTPPNRVAIGQ